MIPNTFTLSALQDFAREVQNKLDSLLIQNVDMNGRRVINAGRAVDSFDYVTLYDAQRLIDGLTTTQSMTTGTGLLNAAHDVRFGAFSTRGAAVAHANELFFASDHNYVGWLSTGSAWVWASGENNAAQAGLATIAALLGTNDASYLVNVTDFTHQLRWTGTAWTFAYGDSGSGYIQGFPIAPPGGTWGVCDGTTYSYLKADGTTANFTTPDYSTSAYLKFGTSATIGPTAASGLTTNVSAGTPSGTNSAPTFTGNAVAAASTNATPDLVAADTSGAGVSPVTTATGSVSAPTFTGNALAGHDHGPNTLELRRSQLIGYFRR